MTLQTDDVSRARGLVRFVDRHSEMQVPELADSPNSVRRPPLVDTHRPQGAEIDRPAYIHALHHFRGVAIVLIVAGHCLHKSGWAVDTLFERWVANLVLGGTALFVFVSGFLFHHVHYSRFEYRSFLAHRARRILVPYLILSAPVVIYRVLIEGGDRYAGSFVGSRPGLFASHIESILHYLWTGNILTGYWYVPVIMVVFALSPAVIAFVRLQPRVRLAILGGLLLLSCALQRPLGNLLVLQSAVYFLPVFLSGVLASIHRKFLLESFQGRDLLLMISTGLVALLQAALYPDYGNLHKPALQWGLPDIVLIQKLLLCLTLMVFLHRFEGRSIPLLKTLAPASFAIFFLHPWALGGLAVGGDFLWGGKWSAGPGMWLLLVGVVLLLTLGVAKLIRLLFGKRSELLIGW